MKILGFLISIVGWAIFVNYTPTLYYVIGSTCLIAGWIMCEEYKK